MPTPTPYIAALHLAEISQYDQFAASAPPDSPWAVIILLGLIALGFWLTDGE